MFKTKISIAKTLKDGLSLNQLRLKLLTMHDLHSRRQPLKRLRALDLRQALHPLHDMWQPLDLLNGLKLRQTLNLTYKNIKYLLGEHLK